MERGRCVIRSLRGRTGSHPHVPYAIAANPHSYLVARWEPNRCVGVGLIVKINDQRKEP